MECCDDELALVHFTKELSLDTNYLGLSYRPKYWNLLHAILFLNSRIFLFFFLAIAIKCSASELQIPDPGRFEKQVIVEAAMDPMQMEVLDDGRIYFIERLGAVKLYEPQKETVVTIGQMQSAYLLNSD